MSTETRWLNSLMEKRRSVFPEQYAGDSVDDTVVRQMIANAALAPSHKLTQPWRFIVYTRDGLRQLGQLQSEVYKRVTMRDGTYRDDKYQSLLSKPTLSSHVIVVWMKRDEKRSVPEVEEIGAVFCAVENMYLTAAAYGVGCYLSTGGITYFPEAKEAFQLGEDDRLIGFFHVGMPKRIPPAPKRKPVDDLLRWVA